MQGYIDAVTACFIREWPLGVSLTAELIVILDEKKVAKPLAGWIRASSL